MNEKTAYIVSCSDHYGFRLHIVDRYFKERGYNVIYLTSDFDHDTKKEFVCDVPGSVQLHARAYKKNLSVRRILSHRGFAKAVYKYLCGLENKPNVVFMHIPPNFLAHYGAKYKKKNPDVKLIFDIFDLWPETFPSNKLKKLLAPAFGVWANLRDKNFRYADFITAECDLFREKLGLDDAVSGTVYLCGKELSVPLVAPVLEEERLELCYLGSINNIISISDICRLLKELALHKPIVLHIIGKGESEEEFVNGAKATGAEVIFHGPVYDDGEKQEILKRCRFGLNIMKKSVCIGLTMKSVEYFRYGLPIVNNIPADTERLVESYGVGIPLDEKCVEKMLSLGVEECLEMRDNVRRTYGEFFTEDKICEKFGTFLDGLVREEDESGNNDIACRV